MALSIKCAGGCDLAPETIVCLPDYGIPHLAALGASGSGKSASYAIPKLRTDPNSAVVLEPKTGARSKLPVNNSLLTNDERVGQPAGIVHGQRWSATLRH
jgi:hypothetical protein